MGIYFIIFLFRNRIYFTISLILQGVYRFKSFAPIRRDCSSKWYVGGAEYFWDLYEGLLAAKERIFIADWFFSPQLYLRREDPLNPIHRLDSILRKKAEEVQS